MYWNCKPIIKSSYAYTQAGSQSVAGGLIDIHKQEIIVLQNTCMSYSKLCLLASEQDVLISTNGAVFCSKTSCIVWSRSCFTLMQHDYESDQIWSW